MLRFLAHVFSVVFHPLLIVTYMLIILLLVNPYMFGVNGLTGGKQLILLIFLSTFIIPAFAVFMMKALGMIDSLQMKTKSERIGPYIVTGILYMWLFQNILNNPEIPSAYKVFVLGATIGLFVAFFFNLFTKISMHALGMGGLLGMIIITSLLFSYGSFVFSIGPFGMMEMSMNALLMLVIILCGIVGTSRLLLNAHNLQDLYSGFIIGLGAQFLALRIMF